MRFGATILSLWLTAFAAYAQDASTTATPTDPSASSESKPPATYFHGHVDQPYIAMTFDDGPSAENTPRLLDMLKQRGIKATFFLIGENAQANPNIVKRILVEGHEVGNHTWTHPQLSKLSDDKVKSEISKTQDAISAASGYTPTILRPPYGAITPRQKEWIEKELKLNVIIWSVDPFDWKRPGSAVVTQRILAGAAPGAIVLSHDIHKQTVDAMPATLDALISKGYKFVTVSQMIALDKPKPSPTPSAESTTKDPPRPAHNTKSNPTTGTPEAQTQGLTRPNSAAATP
jgi:peptidoglycan/xylan/chitin deacetylase (PgdA/CDA1 family)